MDFGGLWSISIDVDRFWSIVVDYGRFSSFFRGFSRIFVDFGLISRRFFVCSPYILGVVSSASVHVVPLFLCFVDLRSLAEHDRQTNRNKKKKNAQVSRPSCAWPLELAHTTFTILAATCEPTPYTFDQASPT